MKRNLNWVYFFVGLVFAILVLEIFYFLNKFGIIGQIQIDANSSLLTFFIFGLLASISSCAVFVGMIILSLTSLTKESSISKTKTILSFQLGRIFAFGIFGIFLGLLGGIFTITPTFNAILLLLVAILMLLIGLNFIGVPILKYVPQSKRILNILNTEKTGFFWLVLVGAFTFFVPCGFTYMVELLALSSASPMRASLILLAFVLGTTPVLTIIGYFGFFIKSSKTILQQILNYFVGSLVVIFALYSINFQISVFGLPNINVDISNKTKVVMEAENNIIQMVYTKYGLTPNIIKLKSGQDYEINISVQETIYGCMSTIFLQGLDEKVQMLEKGNMVKFQIKSPKKGTYEFLCAMGVGHKAKIVVE